MLAWVLSILVLLYVVWHLGNRDWQPLHRAYRALPDRVQKALVVLATTAVLLPLIYVRSLAQGEEVGVFVTAGWLSAATALAFALLRPRG